MANSRSLQASHSAIFPRVQRKVGDSGVHLYSGVQLRSHDSHDLLRQNEHGCLTHQPCSTPHLTKPPIVQPPTTAGRADEAYESMY